MHPVCQLAELRAQILQHLIIEPNSSSSKVLKVENRLRQRTLFSLACCCRLLCEEALDLLWARMPGLLPLLRLLPGFRQVDNRVCFQAFYILAVVQHLAT